MMKNYTSPEFIIQTLDNNDVITTSPYVETSMRDETDGIWDLDHNN